MTAQMMDTLFFNGEKFSLAGDAPLPEQHPRLIRGDEVISSTACWRGYLAIWEIKDNRLFLKSISGRWHLEGKEPLFADWMNGEWRVVSGQCLEYVHLGYESTFERELLVEIEKGCVVGQLEL